MHYAICKKLISLKVALKNKKIELAREVTEVVSRVAKAPKEAIHVFINDMPEGTYYPHGEMKKKN